MFGVLCPEELGLVSRLEGFPRPFLTRHPPSDNINGRIARLAIRSLLWAMPHALQSGLCRGVPGIRGPVVASVIEGDRLRRPFYVIACTLTGCPTMAAHDRLATKAD
jgi:hypothetical protein